MSTDLYNIGQVGHFTGAGLLVRLIGWRAATLDLLTRLLWETRQGYPFVHRGRRGLPLFTVRVASVVATRS